MARAASPPSRQWCARIQASSVGSGTEASITVRRRRVELAPEPSRKRRVRDVADQDVLERELHVALDLALRVAPDEAACLERFQRGRRRRRASPIPSRTPLQNDCPITDACSNAVRASGGSASIRAAIAARTVAGRSPSAASSPSAATSSSRNSGFPSAVATTFATVDGSAPASNVPTTSVASGGRERFQRQRRLADHAGAPRGTAPPGTPAERARGTRPDDRGRARSGSRSGRAASRPPSARPRTPGAADPAPTAAPRSGAPRTAGGSPPTPAPRPRVRASSER